MSNCWFPVTSFDAVHTRISLQHHFSAKAIVIVRIEMWLKENRFCKVLPSLHPSSLIELCKVKMVFAFWFPFI